MDPTSTYLFILIAELLAIYVKNSKDIRSLNVLGTRVLISQLADDSTLFLSDAEQIPVAINLVSRFSKASGLQLNLKKCELIALHNHAESHLFNIPLKNEIKYLGIVITKDPKIREKRNLIDNMKKKSKYFKYVGSKGYLYIWKNSHTESEALSRLIYLAFSLSISDSWIKDINQIQYKFIWKNKHHYIRKSDVVKPINEGGLNVMDFDVMNGTLKLRWLQAFLRNKHSAWFSFSSKIFDSLGGIDFLLRCDF